MSVTGVDPGWLNALRSGAVVPPLRLRVPLWAQPDGTGSEVAIGSVEPDFLQQKGLQAAPDGRGVLSNRERPERGWLLHGNVTQGLNALAARMRAAGLAGAWRNEQLGVNDATGGRVGTIERAGVRPLGITTLAVHLIGVAPDGRFWVQQRAFDKANDPGQWDTLMGGMVSAADTVQTALVRETWEEAGLHADDLPDMRRGGRIHTARPAADGNGAGYVDEHIDWYACTVPAHLTPVNQDGEVEKFVLMDTPQLLAEMQQNTFTTEAALIFADYLGL